MLHIYVYCIWGVPPPLYPIINSFISNLYFISVNLFIFYIPIYLSFFLSSLLVHRDPIFRSLVYFPFNTTGINYQISGQHTKSQIQTRNLINTFITRKLWNRKTTLKQYWSTFMKTVEYKDDIKTILKYICCCYKANCFTSKLLNQILSEMVLFTLHNCCASCSLGFFTS